MVALDKLSASGSFAPGTRRHPNRPVVPALAVQSEYGFTVSPYRLSGGSSLTPQPSPDGPDPLREKRTGFDGWAAAGVDTMLVVPRASTHLEYTDIPLALPGQPLRPGPDQRLRAALARPLPQAPGARRQRCSRRTFSYLEPVGEGLWSPVTLQPRPAAELLLLLGLPAREPTRLKSDGDVTGVGC